MDRAPRPGGVCLYRGCIPSKTFLHLAELVLDAAAASSRGIAFGAPRIDPEGLRRWKGQVIEKMSSGLAALARR